MTHHTTKTMPILLCSPMLSYPGHYIRLLNIRAISLELAGASVIALGFPAQLSSRGAGATYTYIGADRLLSTRSLCIIAGLRKYLGKYWLFIGEVFLMQYLALRYARLHKIPVTFICDLEPWLFPPAWWLARLRGRPRGIVGFISSMFGVRSSMLRAPFYTRARNRLNKLMVKLLPRYLDLIFDSTHALQHYAVRQGARVHIISEGYCLDVPQLSQAEARQLLHIPPATKMLLLFGVATPGKGADLLLQALHNVPPSFHVYIVGKSGGDHHYAWQGYSAELARRWQGYLHVIPRYVSEKERYAFYSACDAVVLPYRSGYFMSSGNFRDAVDYGKAVLVSDQFVIGEITRKYDLGILFKPDDVDDLQRALLDFAQKPQTWFTGIAERSKSVVQEYSWKKTGVRYRELFEQVMAAH